MTSLIIETSQIRLRWPLSAREWRGWSWVAKEAEAIDTACAIARGCKDGTYSKETSNKIAVKRTVNL